MGHLIYWLGRGNQYHRKYKKNPSLASYLLKLLLFGTGCYLSSPLIFLYAHYGLSVHSRWMPVFLGVEVSRFVQAGVLVYQVLARDSVYGRMTIHDRSFMMQQGDNKYL